MIMSSSCAENEKLFVTKIDFFWIKDRPDFQTNVIAHFDDVVFSPKRHSKLLFAPHNSTELLKDVPRS